MVTRADPRYVLKKGCSAVHLFAIGRAEVSSRTLLLPPEGRIGSDQAVEGIRDRGIRFVVARKAEMLELCFGIAPRKLVVENNV